MGDKKRKFLLGLAVAGTTLGIMTGTAKDAKHEDNKRNTIKKEESHKISKNVITDAKTQVKNGPEVYSLEGRTPEGLAIYRNVWKEIEPLYNELKKEQKIFEDSRLYNSMSKEEKARLQLEKKQNISKLIKKEIAMAVERTGKKCSTQDIELFYNEEYGAGFILKINNTHKIYSYNLDGLQHIGIGISDLIKSIFEDWDEFPNNNKLNLMVYNMRYITTTAKNQYIIYIDDQFLSTYVSVPYKENISNKLKEYKEELEYLQNIFEYGEIYNQLSEHEIELNKSVVDDYIRLHICTEWASIITEKTGKECNPKDVMLSFDNNGVAILSWHNKILNIDSFRILDKPEGIPEELYRQTEACRKLRGSTTNNRKELRMLVLKAIQTTLDSKLLDFDVVNDEKIKNFIQPSEATQDNNVDKGRE